MPVTSMYLTTNLLINGFLHNVETMSIAVSNKDSFIKMPKVSFESALNFGGISLYTFSNVPEELKTEYIRMRNLDNLFLYTFPYSETFKCPKLIKTDAEGADADILLGATEIIRRCKPVLYVENNCKDVSKKMLSVLETLNYTAYWHFPPMIRENNFFG